MRLTRRTKIQITIFLMVSLLGIGIMSLDYMKLPSLWFGIGRYNVSLELPRAGGLYASGNVTYRGTEVGRITGVHLTDTQAVADMSLRSDIKIPSNLQAQVHSVSAIGEQYVQLMPQDGTSPPLKDGDVIPASRATVPPDINALLDAANRGLTAIPQGNLKTAIDESYTAIGGLGPEISRIVKGSTQLATDARSNLDSLTSLIDKSQPVLDSQVQSADSIKAWAAHLATVTTSLKDVDSDWRSLLERKSPANPELHDLINRLQPTLPVLMSNLVNINQVLITYQPNVEQLLVLIPEGTAMMQGGALANQNTKQGYKGQFLDFKLNLNLPPPCTTGFLPAQQQRTATFEDSPDRPAGDLYCRVPQDSPFVAVRGARNYPCETVPGKRAPTVKMCESNDQYVPLNDGWNWKGDPNATDTGQDVPQRAPGTPGSAPLPPSPPPPPIAVAEYDPASGSYVGPDGHVYTQAALSQSAAEKPTWQSMVAPPSTK
ncbi:mammalian cell entry protein [Mycobacterium sp. CBMA 234]|uniref:MCE family protein n=1 Tax=Mycolicibacterium sp. CBMA 234 TaxID=1918495 RepID=UPI0012DEBD3F|nr:MlaD family protein [Mycolicibacterium sp. CBMA 234]MUL65956.1 mammalian cell entry protein [Mycolicibacterium sp. CBMA 234]